MKNENNAIKNFTRGGQITLHNMRMFMQVSHKVTVLIGIIFLSITLSMSWLTITPYERYVSEAYIYSTFVPFFNKNAKRKFILPNGQVALVTYTNINQSQLAADTKESVINKIVCAAVVGASTGLIILIGLTYWLRRRGKQHALTKQIRGNRLVPSNIIKKMIIKSKNFSNITIAELPMPKDFETRHTLVHGTTGSGKSVLIRELLDQIRDRGDKAIIYDKGCDFVSLYYREGIDILLNPLDKRATAWHLWDECRDYADFDSLAASLMPMPPDVGDPFWINGARTVFGATAKQLWSHSYRSLSVLLQLLLNADLKTLGEFLKGTEAESLLSTKAEKTAMSIKSMLITYIKSLQYVDDKKDAFSIRQWIQNEDQNNWLFLSSVSDKHETLKPLISMWLDIAANSLMSLPSSHERRIWMIFDELPSLQRIPCLTEAFAEARKFGRCLVAGMQSFSQLKKIYGHHAAEEISNLCNTRIFFRDPSFETAQWASKS